MSQDVLFIGVLRQCGIAMSVFDLDNLNIYFSFFKNKFYFYFYKFTYLFLIQKKEKKNTISV